MKILFFILLLLLNYTQESLAGWRPKNWINTSCLYQGKTIQTTIRECLFIKFCENVTLNEKNIVIQAKNCECAYTGKKYNINSTKHKGEFHVEHIFPWSIIRDQFLASNLDIKTKYDVYYDIDNLVLIGSNINIKKSNKMENLSKIIGIHKGTENMINKLNCNFCKKWNKQGIMTNCGNLPRCF